jgi:hypothetical protein
MRMSLFAISLGFSWICAAIIMRIIRIITTSFGFPGICTICMVRVIGIIVISLVMSVITPDKYCAGLYREKNPGKQYQD